MRSIVSRRGQFLMFRCKDADASKTQHMYSQRKYNPNIHLPSNSLVGLAYGTRNSRSSHFDTCAVLCTHTLHVMHDLCTGYPVPDHAQLWSSSCSFIHHHIAQSRLSLGVTFEPGASRTSGLEYDDIFRQ